MVSNLLEFISVLGEVIPWHPGRCVVRTPIEEEVVRKSNSLISSCVEILLILSYVMSLFLVVGKAMLILLFRWGLLVLFCFVFCYFSSAPQVLTRESLLPLPCWQYRWRIPTHLSIAGVPPQQQPLFHWETTTSLF